MELKVKNTKNKMTSITNLNKSFIHCQQISILSLLQYLIEQIKESNNKTINYSELVKITKNEIYDFIETSLCSTQGSHSITVLDSMFETDDVPEFEGNDYDKFQIPTKVVIQQLERMYKLVNSKQYIKDQSKILKL